jgi:hypothetical protein
MSSDTLDVPVCYPLRKGQTPVVVAVKKLTWTQRVDPWVNDAKASRSQIYALRFSVQSVVF